MREGGREGGMTVIHIIMGMFNSNPIGLYREIAIAIQKESDDSNGGNV